MVNDRVRKSVKSAGPSGKKLEPVMIYRPRVVVKFHDFVKLPYEDGVEKYMDKYQVGNWSRLAEEFRGITLKRLFTSVKPEKIKDLMSRASRRDRNYSPANLLGYFVINCPIGVDPQALVKTLRSWESVETVYVEGKPGMPPQVNPNDDPRSPNQGYLDPAPTGIDAEFSWTINGGDGTGLQFVDLEQGWNLNHEDLTAAGITLMSGSNSYYFYHGTSVLGEVVAVDNNKGDIGISPRASARVISEWRPTYNTADAIIDALPALDFGDVLLLETQNWPSGGGQPYPKEVESAVFDAIRLGVALGIVIVEAAGNGSHDLDTYTDGAGRHTLNRNSADFRDSGAIMVGAASSAVPHTPMYFTNFGSRIDCFAWGENVDTLTTDGAGTANSMYTSTFNGTSSASPIVAGAALNVQGVAESSLGYRFSPMQLRRILSDPNVNTHSNSPASDRIGVMPDLRSILTSVLNVVPDVYIRDYVGDVGNPNTGSYSMSPDIILRNSAVADPNATFGQGSGNESNGGLGQDVRKGQDNYLYVRALNRGSVDATDVTATVYWSPAASLVTPDLWTLIGSVTIPTVPGGNLLTVSDAIVWPKAAIPSLGHYCFICLIGSAADPAPNPAVFTTWDEYVSFISKNNNVAWHNFNVVPNTPPAGGSPPGYVALPFIVPGAPDVARHMRLEVEAGLPKGSRVLLEAPSFMFDAMGEKTPYLKADGRMAVSALHVNPFGRFSLGEMLLPAKLRAQCRVLVSVPEEYRKNAYEVRVRQIYRGREVGRVTWLLVPAKRKSPE